ncbi:MAG: hypothetical protein CMQ24_13865 [Gammaproteobacteria bacterium]|nr:hypothetical protein [Gammaproteobacteria bacterium]
MAASSIATLWTGAEWGQPANEAAGEGVKHDRRPTFETEECKAAVLRQRKGKNPGRCGPVPDGLAVRNAPDDHLVAGAGRYELAVSRERGRADGGEFALAVIPVIQPLTIPGLPETAAVFQRADEAVRAVRRPCRGHAAVRGLLPLAFRCGRSAGRERKEDEQGQNVKEWHASGFVGVKGGTAGH